MKCPNIVWQQSMSFQQTYLNYMNQIVTLTMELFVECGKMMCQTAALPPHLSKRYHILRNLKSVQICMVICTNLIFIKSEIILFQASLDLILNPSLFPEQKKGISAKKKYFKKMFDRLDQSLAYPGFFSSMWYSTLPCFDVKGVTAEKEGSRSGMTNWRPTGRMRHFSLFCVALLRIYIM